MGIWRLTHTQKKSVNMSVNMGCERPFLSSDFLLTANLLKNFSITCVWELGTADGWMDG